MRDGPASWVIPRWISPSFVPVSEPVAPGQPLTNGIGTVSFLLDAVFDTPLFDPVTSQFRVEPSSSVATLRDLPVSP